MSFEIQPVIDEMKQVFVDAYGENYEDVKDLAEKYLIAAETRLKLLTEQQITEGVTEDFLLERLKEEPKILLQEFESFKVKGQQIAQDTANKAIEVFADALLDLAGSIGSDTEQPAPDPENIPNDPTLNMGEVPEEDDWEDEDEDEEKKTL